jgi:hypothetical protein
MTFEAMANVAGSPRGHSEKMSLGDTRQQIEMTRAEGSDKKNQNCHLKLESFFQKWHVSW